MWIPMFLGLVLIFLNVAFNVDIKMPLEQAVLIYVSGCSMCIFWCIGEIDSLKRRR